MLVVKMNTRGVQVYKSMPAVAHFSGVKFDEEDGEVSTHTQQQQVKQQYYLHLSAMVHSVAGGKWVNS